MHDPDTAPALVYLPVPLLVWAAVRFGPRGLMSALSLVTVLAIASMANDQGPLVSGSTSANVFTLQLFLLGVGVPLFFLAALVREREDAQVGLEQSERRYRAVVSNFPHGAVLLFGPDLRHLFADGQGLPAVGLTRDSIEGKTVWEAFPAEVAAALAPRYEAALAGARASFDLVHAGRTYQAQVLARRLRRLGHRHDADAGRHGGATSRGPGRPGPRQDGLLQQREPRASYPAHAAAGAAPGVAGSAAGAPRAGASGSS